MAIVILKQAGLSGGFQTVGTRTVKNLGWLFRHANEVTELHFKKALRNDGQYQLRAIMMNGNVYETECANRGIFAQVFNRNRTLQGVVVFFDNEEWQAVGELTAVPAIDFKDVNGEQIHVGSRVEIGPNYDFWMRGARFGVVTKLMSSEKPAIKVCLDKTNTRHVFVAADCKRV